TDHQKTAQDAQTLLDLLDPFEDLDETIRHFQELPYATTQEETTTPTPEPASAGGSVDLHAVIATPVSPADSTTPPLHDTEPAPHPFEHPTAEQHHDTTPVNAPTEPNPASVDTAPQTPPSSDQPETVLEAGSFAIGSRAGIIVEGLTDAQFRALLTPQIIDEFPELLTYFIR